jgi:NDP-sugar pyrophosphorylase family protein
VLQPLASKPLLRYVLDTAQRLEPARTCLVHGHGGDAVRAAFAQDKLDWALQAEQKGTGHAVMQAMPGVPDDHLVLVLYGDVPLLDASTLHELVSRSERMVKLAGSDDARHALERLAERDSPLVLRLAKAPGQREERWAHLLCGPVDASDYAGADAMVATRAGDSGIEARLAALEARVAALEQSLGESPQT